MFTVFQLNKTKHSTSDDEDEGATVNVDNFCIIKHPDLLFTPR